MRILLDNCTPRGIVMALQDHEVRECRSFGWDKLRNSDLLDAAEAAGFESLITADQNLAHQQNLGGRRIGVVALGSNRWQLIRRCLSQIASAVETAQPGRVTEIRLADE